MCQNICCDSQTMPADEKYGLLLLVVAGLGERVALIHNLSNCDNNIINILLEYSIIMNIAPLV